MRSAQFFQGDVLARLSLYDVQDCPDLLVDLVDWRGIVINWALPVASELAVIDASAEDLAHVVCARWKQFIDDRQASQFAEQKMAVKAAMVAENRAVKLQDLVCSRWMWRAVAVVGWGSFFFLVWVVLRGFK